MGEGEEFVFLGRLSQQRVLRRGESPACSDLSPRKAPSLPGSLFLAASLTQLCDPSRQQQLYLLCWPVCGAKDCKRRLPVFIYNLLPESSSPFHNLVPGKGLKLQAEVKKSGWTRT